MLAVLLVALMVAAALLDDNEGRPERIYFALPSAPLAFSPPAPARGREVEGEVVLSRERPRHARQVGQKAAPAPRPRKAQPARSKGKGRPLCIVPRAYGLCN